MTNRFPLVAPLALTLLVPVTHGRLVYGQPTAVVTVEAAYTGHSELLGGTYTDTASGTAPETVTTHVDYVHAPYTLNSTTSTWIAPVADELHIAIETSQNTYWFEGGLTRASGAGSFSVSSSAGCLVRVIGELILDAGGSGPRHPFRNWDITLDFGSVSIDASGTIDEGSHVQSFAIDETFYLPEEGLDGSFVFDLSVDSPGAGHGHVDLHGVLEFQLPTCAGDVDWSCEIDILDLLALLAAWGPCDDCPADIDVDGSVGFTDLLTLMVNWGPCP